MKKFRLINTLVLLFLFFLNFPSQVQAVGMVNFYSGGKQVNTIICGESYTFDIPNYSGKTVWLRQTKNEVTLSEGQYRVSGVPATSKCNIDEGIYTTTAYSFSTDPVTNTLVVGDLLATGTLTVKAKPPTPNIIIQNLTNSTRTREVWTEDFIKIKLNTQFLILNRNQPVELCHLHSAQTTCSFVSSYTDPIEGSWELVYQMPTIASTLGKAEDWVRINGIESNHYAYNVSARPNDPSLGVTCYLIQSRTHSDVWVGDKVTWTVLSRPKGYRAYWYGSKNNISDAYGVPTGHSSNGEWLSEAYPTESVGNYTRWIQFRDKNNNYVCNTNMVIFSVTKPAANSSLIIRPSLLGNLVNLLKLLTH